MSLLSFGQDVCSDAQPFCTDLSYNFPLATDNTSEDGPFYDCLATQPNPVWYFLRISEAGDIDIDIRSAPGEFDVDFICWGPYDQYRDMCSGLTEDKVMDCSYDPRFDEECNIEDAQVGEFYMLLITNFSRQETDVAFSKVGGEGETDCSIVEPCTTPDFSIAITPPTCCGDNAVLSYNGPGVGTNTMTNLVDNTFEWNVPNGVTVVSGTLSGTGVPGDIVITVPCNVSLPPISLTIMNSSIDLPCDPKTDTVVIDQKNDLQVALTPQNVSCYQANDGQITTVLNNFNGPASYAWSPTGTGANPSGLGPGQYIVTVTEDESGCSVSDTATITEPGVLSVQITDRPVDCNGTIDGLAFLDDCGTCVGGTTGKIPCTRDCNGDWGGTAYLDDCGDCVGGTTGNDACIYLEASFLADNWFIVEDNVITFVDASFGNNIVSWDWEFGNGADPAVANTQGPHVVTYNLAGVIPVTLTITDNLGNIKTFTRNVNIISAAGDDCKAAYVDEFNTMPAINHYEEFVRDVQTNRVVNSDALTSSIVNGALHVDSDGSEHTTASLPLTGAPINFANARFITIRIRASEAMGMRVTLRDGNLTQAQMDQLQPQTDLNITTEWQEFVIDLGVVAQLQDGWIFQGNNFNEQVLHHLVLIPNPDEHEINPYTEPLDGWFEVDYFLLGTNTSEGCVSLSADCFGVGGGTAIIDSCGDCTGGLTGIEANDLCEFDCNGDANGTAFTDSCGVCAGGNTNIDPNSSCTIDCHGDIDGTAFIDNCGRCVEGLTGVEPCEQDCEGNWGGTAFVDNCGDCVAGNTGLEPCFNNCVSSPIDLSVAIIGGTPLYTHVWDNGLGNDPVLSNVLAGTYGVTVSDSSGCDAYDDTTIVVAVLVVDAGEDQSFCEGGSGVQLNGTGGATFVWSPGRGLSDSTVADPIATPDSTTIYVLTSSDGSCEGTDTVVVTVYSLPGIEAGADSSICLGDSLDITATGGVRYFWDNGLDSGATHSVGPTTTTTYNLTGLDTNGCVDTASIQVSVDPLPNITSSDASVCKNDTISIVATGGGAYSWVSLNHGIILAGADDGRLTVQTGLPGNTVDTLACFEVTGSDANGCVNKDTACVNFEANCGPIVEATGDTICEGELGNLNATAHAGAGDYTFTWNGGNLVNATGATQTDNPTATTDYTVIVSDGNNDRDTAIVQLVVYPLPTITALADDTICRGSSDTIYATGAATYQWDNGPTDSSQLITPTVTTTYTVTGTDTNGCVNTASVTITVDHVEAEAGDDINICVGGQVQLAASGGDTYRWTPNDGTLSSTTIVNPIATPTDTTTYYVEVRSAIGHCVAYDSVTINTGGLVVDLGPDDTLCLGESYQFNVGVVGDYSWQSDNDTLSSTTVYNPLATPTVTSIYTVHVSDPDIAGCEDRDSITIYVEDVTAGIITAPQIICRGDELLLTATGGGTYQWTGTPSGTNITNPTSATPTVAPLIQTTYTVTVSNSSGKCSDTAELTIDVDSIVASASADFFMCLGSTSSLLNVTAPGATSYSWSPITYLDNATIANPQIVNPTVAGTISYEVSVSNANNCVDKDTVEVTIGDVIVKAEALSPRFCVDDTGQVRATTTTTGALFSWQSDGGILIGTSSQTPGFTATDTGTYILTVTATDGNGQCPDVDSTTIAVANVYADAGVDTTVCKDDELTLNGAYGPSYSWSPAEQLLANTDAFNPTVNTSGSGTRLFVLTVTDNSLANCEATDTVEVTVEEVTVTAQVGPDNIMEGETAVLNATTNGTYVIWSEEETGELVDQGAYPGINNLAVSPTENTIYIVESINDNDCRDTASVHLQVISTIKIPNVITPNGDGINDTWVIRNIEDYPDAEIKIRNRWGNIVWKQKDGYNNSWPGGNERQVTLPVGTYYFEIKLNYRGLRYSGDVTILR